MHQGAEHGRGNSQVPEHGAIASDQGVVVLARPPIVYLVSILAGFGLNAVWPARMMPSAIEPIGGWLILLAVALFALSVREFRRARTPIRTRKLVTVVITTGPYRFSRNPIYLSFTLLQLGLGVWANSAWLVGMLIPTLLLMSYGVIAREERYMAQKFGDEYLRYRASVRRWI